MMADAYGKLTGTPGICMVTRGPGASNALAGIHIAKQDSTPVIVFVGQIERGMREREAFQEMDYRAVFGQAAKWATEIDDAARIPEILSRAFHVATSGRPGPVVIALPEDMLVEMATVADAPHYVSIDSAPAAGQMAALAERLSKAKAPVAILGGARWSAQAVEQFAQFAERFKLPVAVSFRRQMLFPANHPCFIGDVGIGLNPELLKRVQDADLVLLQRMPPHEAELAGRLWRLTPAMTETLRTLPDRGLVVLGFPCNQFGRQEPGDAEEIGGFCQLNYGVSFPMMAKVEVNGAGAHPLWRWLKAQAPGLLGTEGVKWNFTKFLVGRDGRVIKRYAPQDAPEKLRADIEAALAEAA
jgi:glutathione peroxidase-family protein